MVADIAQPAVIVGAGQAGSDTAAALRERGFTGSITLVGDESGLPYRRPPLSKSRLAGTSGDEEVVLRPRSFYDDQGIELVGGERVAGIDRDRGRVSLSSGRTLPYRHLVLATGARPRRLAVPGTGLMGVLYLRGLADADALRERLLASRSLLVVGGGFLGLEVAATARGLGLDVTVVEAGSRLLARAVTPAVSDHLLHEHLAQGTRVLTRREVTALHGDNGHVRAAKLSGGESVAADVVVVGIGTLPDTRLAADAGLAVGDGVLVDRRLRTSDPAIRAVGDCARFPRPRADGHIRLESVQNASEQARHVAADICGEPEPYEAVPWFWTEQYTLRLQIAGLTDDHDRAVRVGRPGQDRFSVFCFRRGRLVGVESVNRPADHVLARKLLALDDPGLTPDEAAAPDFAPRSLRRGLQPA